MTMVEYIPGRMAKGELQDGVMAELDKCGMQGSTVADLIYGKPNLHQRSIGTTMKELTKKNLVMQLPTRRKSETTGTIGAVWISIKAAKKELFDKGILKYDSNGDIVKAA